MSKIIPLPERNGHRRSGDGKVVVTRLPRAAVVTRRGDGQGTAKARRGGGTRKEGGGRGAKGAGEEGEVRSAKSICLC